VISKRFAGTWARAKYPQWSALLDAALRRYAGRATRVDEQLLYAGIEPFL
jgi:hypothetical protein